MTSADPLNRRCRICARQKTGKSRLGCVLLVRSGLLPVSVTRPESVTGVTEVCNFAERDFWLACTPAFRPVGRFGFSVPQPSPVDLAGLLSKISQTPYRNDWIHFRCPPRWNIASRQGHSGQQQRNEQKCKRIRCAHTIEHASHHTRQSDRTD